MNTAQQPTPAANEVDPRCAVCDHTTASHDGISQRYCDATQAQALPRKCICASGPMQGNPPARHGERRFHTQATRTPGPASATHAQQHDVATAELGPAKGPADRLADSADPEIRPVGESMADVSPANASGRAVRPE